MLAGILFALAPLLVDSAGAASTVTTQIAERVHLETGRQVVIRSGTVGQIRKRLAGGDRADVVIVSEAALRALRTRGVLVPGTETPLGGSPMAVGVLAGMSRPDISTVSAFKATLLKARTIAATDPTAGASSGIYFAKLLRRLGIARQIAPKLRLTPGGRSCNLVALRRADICVQNVTEIVPVRGVVVAGFLPQKIQNVIVYSGAVLRSSRQPSVAGAFVRELVAPRWARLWRRSGFQAIRRESSNATTARQSGAVAGCDPHRRACAPPSDKHFVRALAAA